MVFFGRQQRKPLILRHAARFARVREVQKYEAEDFWREDFLEGNANANPNAKCSGVLAPPARARTRLFFAFSEAPYFATLILAAIAALRISFNSEGVLYL